MSRSQSSRRGGRGRTEEPGPARQKRDPERSLPERITLAISIAILLALLGLVTYAFLRGDDRPAAIQVEPRLEEVRREGGAYYLPVRVTNRGDRTAEDVQVQLTLQSGDGEPHTVGFTIRFLAGGERAGAVVVFQEDPAGRPLRVSVSFLQP